MNQLRHIADDIGYPTSRKGWEMKILELCLDVEKCFGDLSNIKTEYPELRKCMILFTEWPGTSLH